MQEIKWKSEGRTDTGNFFECCLEGVDRQVVDSMTRIIYDKIESKETIIKIKRENGKILFIKLINNCKYCCLYCYCKWLYTYKHKILL